MALGPFSELLLVLIGWLALVLALALRRELFFRFGWWRGVVEDAALPVAEIGIQQRSFEMGILSTLKEVSRQVVTRPFVLLLADGRRLPVAPDPGAKIRVACHLEPGGGLDVVERHGYVQPGERVCVRAEWGREPGDEAGPYRGNPPHERLRARRGRTMWVASEKTLERHAKHQRRFSVVFALLGVATLAVTLFVVMPMSRTSVTDRVSWCGLILAFQIIFYMLVWRQIRPWYLRRRFNQSRGSYLAALAD